MRYVFGFLCVCALGVVPVVGCLDFDLSSGSCAGVVCPDDANVCTDEHCRCDGWWCTPTCVSTPAADGMECTYDGLGGVCVSGQCGENLCEGVVCDDDDACTDDHCDYVDGSCYVTPTMCDDQNECTEGVCDLADGCTFTPVEDRRNCHPDVSSPIGVCKAGACVALPTDACTNPEDLAVVCDLGFLDEVETCARDAIGDPDAIGDLGATAPCLVENTSVSADCASCYGAVVICIFENCVHVCAPERNSQACDDCQAEYGCDTLLADCTGDLAGECDTGGTMFDVGAFEVQP
jgi:hypothetical protein